MGELGFPIARIGLEWSRIEPEPGHFDHAVIDRYREELADLKERGIKPLVTLHHFSNPLWLERSGQWTNPLSIKAFLRYVRYVVRALCDLVDEWVTINEPNVYATQAHLFHEGPPGNVSLRDTLKVMRHMAIAVATPNLASPMLAAFAVLVLSGYPGLYVMSASLAIIGGISVMMVRGSR